MRKTITPIKKGLDKKGNPIILCKDSVWIIKTNYKLGRDVKTLCYIKENISFEEAEKIYNKYTKK